MNDALLLTSSESKKTGSAIRRAKQNVMAQLTLLAQRRRNVNVQRTLSLMIAMKELSGRRTQLYALLASGKLVDAALFLQRQSLLSSSSFSSSSIDAQTTHSNSHLDKDTLTKLRGVYSIK